MSLKVKLNKILATMWLAWTWLLFLVLHIIFFSSQAPQNTLLVIFDKMVMISCFLLYPIASDGRWNESLLPFAGQFFFWWAFGFMMMIFYSKLKKVGNS